MVGSHGLRLERPPRLRGRTLARTAACLWQNPRRQDTTRYDFICRYPDGGKHRDILRRVGLGEAEIERVTSLPAGFARGQVVAVLELGETVLLDAAERRERRIEEGACAYGDDMGKYVTTVRRAAFLREPVAMRGQPGIFRAPVPLSAIPDGFE